jgi:hypothetical protein
LKTRHCGVSETGSAADSARSLTNLAQSYFDLGTDEGRSACVGAADRLPAASTQTPRDRGRESCWEIESRGESHETSSLWHEAWRSPARLMTRSSFKAEHQLFKLPSARETRRSTRSAEDLSAWPLDFAQRAGGGRVWTPVRDPSEAKQRSVAGAQLGPPIQRNPVEGTSCHSDSRPYPQGSALSQGDTM